MKVYIVFNYDGALIGVCSSRWRARRRAREVDGQYEGFTVDDDRPFTKIRIQSDAHREAVVRHKLAQAELRQQWGSLQPAQGVLPSL